MRAPPAIVGVVNLTADSFSDGGRYLEPAAAVRHARRLAADGADVIELGPAASSPDAQPVTPDEERQRLDPVLDVLLADGMRLAVDSMHAATQRHCAERGVALLNDIRGFPDRTVHGALARASCRLVVMHAVQGGPATRVRTDAAAVRDGIYRFFEARLGVLEAAGIARDRCVIDPGMGYFLGSDPEPSLLVLRDLARLRRAFGLPVLVSVSRKSFLGALTGRDVAARGAATLAAELFAAGQGVDYLRTHDVAALRDALTVLARLGA